MDSEGGAILVLLDLSAAFDTIDYQKLLNLLDYSFGIRGDSLRWFKSYLQDRTQTVQIGSSTSEPVTLKYGVPQGSVLGPILFTMNTTPLGNICNHSLDFHLYADDTQFYLSFKPRDSISRQTAISQVEACIKDIKTWMTNNLLKLNDDKTELLVITTIMYSIGKIRKYLDKPTTEKMINSAVTSRLDYCNSLLYGINGYLVSQLQRCQNNAARIVSLRRKYDHITPVLKDLHWLPVEHRINYKILLLAYKAQQCMAPSYLSSLLSPYKPGRSLWSEGKHLLTTLHRLEGFGKHCFAHDAPTLWNTLPISIKCAQSIDTFKSSLKTHLFNVAFS